MDRLWCHESESVRTQVACQVIDNADSPSHLLLGRSQRPNGHGNQAVPLMLTKDRNMGRWRVDRKVRACTRPLIATGRAGTPWRLAPHAAGRCRLTLRVMMQFCRKRKGNRPQQHSSSAMRGAEWSR